MLAKERGGMPSDATLQHSKALLVEAHQVMASGRGPLARQLHRFNREQRKRLKGRWVTKCQMNIGQVVPRSDLGHLQFISKHGHLFLRTPLSDDLLQAAERHWERRSRRRGQELSAHPPLPTALCLRVKRPKPKHQIAIAIGIISLGVLGALVVLLFPLTLRLQRIEGVVRRVAGGDLRARTGDARRDAVGSLARSVDQIGARIEALLASQRQMHASVSHELRTPLARLAAAIDLAEDHPKETLFDGMRTDIRELDLLVDELLTLSRLQDPGARAALNDIDLTRLARERFDAAQRGDQHQLDWSFEADDNLSLRADARLLARLLDNLLTNAARHAQGAVALRLSQTDDGTRIEVADDGPGVPEAQRTTLFDPFVSVSPGGSAGLGLAICREIADLHGGTLKVGTSDLGGANFHFVVS
jgi:signal transduction histidine kinase